MASSRACSETVIIIAIVPIEGRRKPAFFFTANVFAHP